MWKQIHWKACASYTRTRRRGNCLFCSTLTHKSVNWKVEWDENLSLFKGKKKKKKSQSDSYTINHRTRRKNALWVVNICFAKKSNFKIICQHVICLSLHFKKAQIFSCSTIEHWRRQILILMMWRTAKKCDESWESRKKQIVIKSNFLKQELTAKKSFKTRGGKLCNNNPVI